MFNFNNSLEVQCLDKICSLHPYPEKPIEDERDIKNNLPSALFEKLISRQKFKHGHGSTLFFKNYACGTFGMDNNDPQAFNLKVDLLNMTGAELTQKVKAQLNKNIVLVHFGSKIDNNLKLNMQGISNESHIKYILKM